MHIPDGYLSPSTCAVMYGGSAPFWWLAVRRVRKKLNARFIPVLALFSAFCFVIMMFNVPLPGGTTGHAVGIGLAPAVVGPWAAILGISVALAIQALFFGDGGITAYGANCFNMAIAGCLVSAVVYRLIAGRCAAGSARRVAGAALGGYIGINFAALCAAIELGLQPGLFHDASGAPLYAPYPLHVAIAAMLGGHLTIAGAAEFIISGAVVACLQRAHPALLLVPGSASDTGIGPITTEAGRGIPIGLWIGLSIVLLATPLGLLAAGSAWGEWSPEDFRNGEMRRQIAVASQNNLPPAEAPRGLERLSAVWTAPMKDYAPSFMKSPSFGYILSAMMGAGLIILAVLAAGWMFGLARTEV